MNRNLVAVIFVLLTLSSLVVAQDNEVIHKQIEAMIAVPQQKLARVQLEERVRCVLGLQQTITAGIFDSLALPTEPTFKSPALLSVLPTSTTNYKDFDDQAVNKVVGHSFLLRNYRPCEARLCSALLEVAVCNSGKNLWRNDKLYVGTVDGGKLIPSISYGDIWKPNESGKCKNISIPISPGLIASWPYLEVVIQDDTTVDAMKLTLNY